MRTFLLLIMSLFSLFNSADAMSISNANADMDKHILALVKSQDFDKLDTMLEEIERNYENDYLMERRVDIAFGVFLRPRKDLERLLGNWIKRKPNSYAAYMARGVYYAKVGWGKRGTKYIHETTKKQVDGMSYYFQKAFKDFEQARAINPKLLHPLCFEIDMLGALGEKDRIQKLYEDGLKINPMSLTLRWQYISMLLPRWGGSISEIEDAVATARPHYSKNPALKILEGRVSAELGDQAVFNQDYTKAIQLYSEALKSGDSWFYYNQRGEAYTYSGQLELATVDLKKALSLFPNASRSHSMLSVNLYRSHNYTEAIRYLNIVIEDDPYDHKLLDIRGDCYLRLGKPDLALSDFEQAVALQPNNPEYLDDRKRAQGMVNSIHSVPFLVTKPSR